MAKKTKSSCDYCMFYEYDEEYECYTCSVSLDEDEMSEFLLGHMRDCPYYRAGDEYTIVHKQI